MRFPGLQNRADVRSGRRQRTLPQGRRYWLRLGAAALVALMVGTIGAVGGLVFLSTARYTNALLHPGCRGPAVQPRQLGIRGAQDVVYRTHDGLPLRAWYVPSRNGAAIVLVPGIDGAREGMLVVRFFEVSLLPGNGHDR